MDANAHGSLTHGSPKLETQMAGAPLNPIRHNDEKAQRLLPDTTEQSQGKRRSVYA